MKIIKELNQAYDKILKNNINENTEIFSIGDLITTQKLHGVSNRFFGIIQGFDEFKDDEEAYNNFKSDKIIIIKPLCTIDGDVVSDFHDLDTNGNIRMGNKSYRITKIDKNKIENAKNKAVNRAANFEEIMRSL